MVVECKCGPHVSTQTSAGDSDYSATRMCYINRRVYYFPMAEFTFSVMHSCIQLFLVNPIQLYVDYMGKTSVGSNWPSSYQTALSQHVHVWFYIGSFWLHSVGHIWFQARNFSSLGQMSKTSNSLCTALAFSSCCYIFFISYIFTSSERKYKSQLPAHARPKRRAESVAVTPVTRNWSRSRFWKVWEKTGKNQKDGVFPKPSSRC